MAIDISRLAPDRLPHPEWPPAATAGRYALPALRVLAALESAGAPAALLDSLRKTAATGAAVEVFLAADRGQLALQLDGRRLPLSGMTRDVVLVLLGESARAAVAAPAAAGTASAPDPSQAARAASVDAQVQEARQHPAGLPAQVLERTAPAASAALAQPLLDAAGSAQAAAHRLAQAVQNCGWFLEHHAAQWVSGERTLEQLQDEVGQMPAALRTGGGAAAEARAGAQLDSMQRAALALAGQAWPGQGLSLQIEGDRHRGAPGAVAEVFEARLQMQLPRLGALAVRIRVLDGTIAVQVDAEQTGTWAAALPQLGSALSARGLTIAGMALRQPASGAPALEPMARA